MTTTAKVASQSAPPSGKRRRVWRYVRLALILYLSSMLAVSLCQRWIIFPGMAATHGASARLFAPKDSTLLWLPMRDGSQAAALFCPARQNGLTVTDSRQSPTLLYFYGNAQCIAWALDEMELFRDCGFNVLVGDYPGFGLTPGKATETSCYALADAMWEWAAKTPQVDASRIAAGGWSLGAAMAIDLAARRPVAGLVTLSAFTSLDDMGRVQMPFYPTGLMLEHHFRSLEKMPSVKCPVLLFHGAHDSLVPPGMMPRLAAAARQATTVSINSDHNDIILLGHDIIRTSLRDWGRSLQDKDGAR